MPDEIVLKKIRDASPEEKEQLIKQIEQTAAENGEVYKGCALCVLSAVLTNLDIGDSATVKTLLKAAIAPSAGSRRGGQCGAATGGLMALGLIYGPDELDECSPSQEPSSSYEEVMMRAQKLCDTFRKEYSGLSHQHIGLTCPAVQKKLVGTVYNSSNPKWEGEQFHERCVKLNHPCLRVGARAAAKAILASASELETEN